MSELTSLACLFPVGLADAITRRQREQEERNQQVSAKTGTRALVYTLYISFPDQISASLYSRHVLLGKTHDPVSSSVKVRIVEHFLRGHSEVEED